MKTTPSASTRPQGSAKHRGRACLRFEAARLAVGGPHNGDRHGALPPGAREPGCRERHMSSDDEQGAHR